VHTQLLISRLGHLGLASKVGRDKRTTSRGDGRSADHRRKCERTSPLDVLRLDSLPPIANCHLQNLVDLRHATRLIPAHTCVFPQPAVAKPNLTHSRCSVKSFRGETKPKCQPVFQTHEFQPLARESGIGSCQLVVDGALLNEIARTRPVDK
jgi:hypothetical protein